MPQTLTSRTRGTTVHLCAIVMAAVLAGPSATAAQTAVSIADGSGGVRPATEAELLASAAERGGVRVIVRLRTDTAPEATLDAAAAASQRDRIASAQAGLLARIEGESQVRQFAITPHIAMSANRQTLQQLLRDAAVESIFVDVPDAPSLAQSVPLIRADEVVKRGSTGAGWSIAVLDTGVQKSHAA